MSEQPPTPEGAGTPRDNTETTVSIGSVLPVESDAGLRGLSQEDKEAVAALPRSSALLIVERGPSAGARFLLDADRTLAGRSEAADIFLDDVTVSRRHVEFYRRGGSFGVRDVGSLNGTYVNRERIDEAELGGGDEIQIGKFRLVLLTNPRRG